MRGGGWRVVFEKIQTNQRLKIVKIQTDVMVVGTGFLFGTQFTTVNRSEICMSSSQTTNSFGSKLKTVPITFEFSFLIANHRSFQ